MFVFVCLCAMLGCVCVPNTGIPNPPANGASIGNSIEGADQKPGRDVSDSSDASKSSDLFDPRPPRGGEASAFSSSIAKTEPIRVSYSLSEDSPTLASAQHRTHTSEQASIRVRGNHLPLHTIAVGDNRQASKETQKVEVTLTGIGTPLGTSTPKKATSEENASRAASHTVNSTGVTAHTSSSNSASAEHPMTSAVSESRRTAGSQAEQPLCSENVGPTPKAQLPVPKDSQLGPPSKAQQQRGERVYMTPMFSSMCQL